MVSLVFRVFQAKHNLVFAPSSAYLSFLSQQAAQERLIDQISGTEHV